MEANISSSLLKVLCEVIVSLDNLGVPVYKIDPSVRSESVCAELVRVVDR